MRQLLLDTHVFLWSQFEPAKLTVWIRDLLEESSVCWHLSQVSAGEIVTLDSTINKYPVQTCRNPTKQA